MRAHRLIGTTLALAAVLLLLPPAVRAQSTVKDPKFEFGKKEEVKAVEWKAQAKLGGILTTGNSQAGSVSLGGAVSRKARGNKFAFEGNWGYARSRILQAADGNENGSIEPWEITRQDQISTNYWMARGRYDRFFSANNSGYVIGAVAGDEPAGKDIFGGAQVGYSRVLFKDNRNEAVVELGYDFTYESYVGKTDSLAIHSMRIFAGYTLKLTDASGLFANLETISNLNTERVPTQDGTNEAGPFRDTRLNGKAGISATIWKKLSVSLGVTLKFDNTPAPLPPFKLPFAPGFVPIANKLDTITEAALIYNLL